jgi:hypothetical protein
MPAGKERSRELEGVNDRLHIFGETCRLIAGSGIGRSGAAVSTHVEANLDTCMIQDVY